jgi:hypothetical protein
MTLSASPFGTDTSCTDFLVPGRLVSGTELLAQAAYRRLITVRGQLEDDLNYGFAICQKLNSELTDVDLATLGGLIRLELLKDDRIEEVVVSLGTVRNVSSGVEMNITITLTAKDDTTFTLVLLATEVTLTILSIGGT